MRRTKPVPLARAGVNKLIETLRHGRSSEWPRHLSSAFEILTTELKIDRQAARELLIGAALAAHACARAVNWRALERSRADAHERAQKAFLRLARCAGRSPAKLRHCLDRSVRSALSGGIVDCELLQQIVDQTGRVFRNFPQEPSAATALRAMGFPDLAGQQQILLIGKIEALPPASGKRVEQALSIYSATPRSSWTAAGLFEALATALSDRPASCRLPGIGDLLVEYVGIVEVAWKRLGLKPATRAPSGGRHLQESLSSVLRTGFDGRHGSPLVTSRWRPHGNACENPQKPWGSSG